MPSWKKLISSGSSAVLSSLTLDSPLAVAQGGTGATSLNNLITLGTHTTGNYVSTVVAGSGIDVSGATGDVTISIGTGEVVNAMIGDDEINSEHYAAGSIDNEHLADDAVDSDELAADAVDDAHLSDGVATGLAGAGMTATSGVMNVIGGDGITANADDVAVTAAQTTITSVLNTGLVVGRDADNDIDFATDNNIIFRAGGEDQLTLVDGALTPSSNAIVDLGTDALEFKDAYFDGTVETDALTIGGVSVEAGADVTDTTNVTSAGALMDSEVDADIKTLSLPASTTISTFGASLVDDAAASNARTTLGLGTSAVLSTAAIANSGTGVATADQIHTFVTTQTDEMDAGTSGNAATATLASTVTVSDSTANTNFPITLHNESNALLDDTGAFTYNPSTGTLKVENIDVAGTQTFISASSLVVTSSVIFEGATSDGHETTLTVVDPTADRTITLQNDDGTVAFTSDITGTNSNTNTGDQDLWDVVAGDSGTTTANTATDTLTIAGGTGITTAVSGDTLTVTSAVTAGNGLTLNTADIDIDATQTTLTSILNDALVVGRDAHNQIIFSTDNEIHFKTNNETPVIKMKASGEIEATSLDISGDVDVDGTLETDALTIGGTTSVPFESGDHSKLDAIEASADVTDATNVTAAGALMDSELTSIADVKALDQSVVSGATPTFTTTNFTDATNKRLMTDAQETLLDTVETSADVTDATNVTAAGALMDSECASLADVKALDQSVVSGATPTFTTTNFTDATNKRLMTDAQETLLDTVETSADVTDTTNVTAAGALMDSECASLASVKAINQGLTATSDVNFNTININATTTSTTKTSGALIVDGGVGVAENIHAGGDVVAYASSDERLKDNLQVIQDPLDKVGQISGYEFDWNEESPEWAQERGHDIGVVAQEIQKVHPEIVIERTNGYLGVDYKRIIPLLIESIKELKQEVEDLKKKVN